jgi:hypothetical protein
MTLRSIHDLTTEEAYRLAAERFGHDLPPLFLPPGERGRVSAP